MAELGEKPSWFERFRTKKRFVAMDLDSFSEKWSIQLSSMNIFTIVVTLALILIVGTWAIIAYTPVQEMLPNYPEEPERQVALDNAARVDEVEANYHKNDRFYITLSEILQGNAPEMDTAFYQLDSNQTYDQTLDVSRSEEDSLLRVQMEEQDEFSYDQSASWLGSGDNTMGSVVFFTPLVGEVSQSYNPEEGHMGVDIVAEDKEGINCALNGTVILASWTSDAGHVIQVQHSNNLVTVYKHNSVLLKKVGEKVKAGEPLAIIGNSGMYSTGSHLHFELWQNGKPLDPQKFINF